MYFREKDLGIFYVSIYYTSMTSKKLPENADNNDCEIHDDICSTNNNNHCIETVTEIQNTSNEVTLTSKKLPKTADKFYCEKCHFICSKQSNWNQHVLTPKHKNTSNTSISIQKNAVFKCECGNNYKHRQSLYNHKNKCKLLLEPSNHSSDHDPQQQPHHANSDTNNPELVEKMFTMFTQMMTHNQDFMQNVIGKVQGINNIHNSNSHNNTQFNINMFLNEQCKNAMNIGDFIKSLPITAQHYENTKDNGLADTLTNLMVDGLNNMEIVERPIHCTDQKRKVMYVKDNDKWEKDKDNALFLQGVNELADIHKKRVHLWQQENPEFKTREKLQAVFTGILGNLFTDVTEQRKDMTKIFKGVTDSTFLDDNTKNTLASH
tara:strand:- start:663 stop:1793 length:1131 start_codon:yes stop_codon:yes gene_type:complete